MTLVHFEQQNLAPISDAVGQTLNDIRATSPAGFVAAFGIDWNGPKFSQNELPEAWIAEYNERGLLVTDPLAHWATLTTGMATWSELRHSVNHRFFELAEKHTMNFGVVFSGRDKFGRHFLTCVNAEREFKEAELEALNTAFFRLTRQFQMAMKSLSPAE